MNIIKIATIVNKLCESTRGGNIEWNQTEKEDVFETSYPDFAMRLSTRPKKDREAPSGAIDYVISIYNSSGILMESASDIELNNAMDNAYETLSSLYNTARGYALGTEQILDSIISTLDKDDIPF